MSATDQEAVLAVAHDDGLVTWVNGREVCRRDVYTAAILDHTKGNVALKAGINTILLKVGQGTTGWEVAARFLPAKIDRPMYSAQQRIRSSSDCQS